MKSRDEVRDETRRGFRLVGVVLLLLGFGGVAVYLTAPLVASIDPPRWYVAVAVGMLAIGIPMTFPRSTIGHVLAAHWDAALDRWVGPDKDGDG